MILAGDVGGTKVVLALYEFVDNEIIERGKEVFQCVWYNGFGEIVAEFLGKHKDIASGVDVASFGIAGPIENDRCEITNLPWVVDAKELRAMFNFTEVKLLNDLESIAIAVPHLNAGDLHVLNDGVPVTDGVISVIAPGTGLGEAFLVSCGSRYRAFPSEGGHSDLTANTEIERELVAFLTEKFGHASFERAVCGSGIPNIYEFLKSSGRTSVPDWLEEEIANEDDAAPVIERYSRGTNANEICVLTMRIFASLLGAEVGNLALKMLARGGVYMGGGIPPRIIPLLEDDGFMHAFRSKGRMSELVSKIPVYVIMNPEAALLGAARATVA
jgi:glucokinase